MLEKPTAGAFAGAAARGRQQAYNLLVEAIEGSDLSQAKIAEYAGISKEHLSRMLQRPRNVELDTLSRVLFAACAGTFTMEMKVPSAGMARSQGQPQQVPSRQFHMVKAKWIKSSGVPIEVPSAKTVIKAPTPLAQESASLDALNSIWTAGSHTIPDLPVSASNA